MTKAVRIENADTSNYKVIVEEWEKGVDGNPDVLVTTHPLTYPTAMTNGVYITSTRYLIVKETE